MRRCPEGIVGGYRREAGTARRGQVADMAGSRYLLVGALCGGVYGEHMAGAVVVCGQHTGGSGQGVEDV